MILVHQFSAINKAAWRYCKDHLTHSAMSNASYDVCGVIHLNPCCNQDLISKALHMDKSSVAKILLKCEQDGYVIRTINPANRREYILSLTPSGDEAISELIQLVDQWQSDALSVLSESDRIRFLEMVQTLRNHCDQYPNHDQTNAFEEESME